MTEAEWLTSKDPAAMLRHLGVVGPNETTTGVRISDRKLRLFACACARAVWSQLTDPRSRQAVDVSERYADGLATVDDLRQGLIAAGDAWFALYSTTNHSVVEGGWITAGAALIRDIVGNPFRPVTLEVRYSRTYPVVCTPTVLGLARAIYAEPGSACGACRGKGGSWRCPNCHGEWLGDVGPDCFVCSAPRLERRDCNTCRGTGRAGDGLLDPVRLLMLSDALEDAGADASLLSHLRGPGPHCRGCWALDYLLGKE